MFEEKLMDRIAILAPELIQMSDYIFDQSELGNQEFKSSAAIMDFLAKEGFSVESGIAGLPTAFRAVWEKGTGGPSIGFLCEYDAIEGMGHACGHHMQGPVAAGAAVAVKTCLDVPACKLVVYGTPAEETACEKVRMVREGCFNDIDVALMFHGNPTTSYDVDSLAMNSFNVAFHGKSAHAAIAPEDGRSSFDALLLSFQAIEFMREHVKDDVRMHYTVLDAGGPANVVPSKAVGNFVLRSYNREYLNQVVERFKKIVTGAALMTETTCEIQETKSLDNRIGVPHLNALLMRHAQERNAPRISPPREKNGSSDFGNVMYRLPGACLRVAFVPEGTSSHTKAFFDAGKSGDAHRAVILGAEILSLTARDLICCQEDLETVKEEFAKIKAALDTNRA